MSSKNRPPNNGGSSGRHNLSPKFLAQFGRQVAAPLASTLGANVVRSQALCDHRNTVGLCDGLPAQL